MVLAMVLISGTVRSIAMVLCEITVCHPTRLTYIFSSLAFEPVSNVEDMQGVLYAARNFVGLGIENWNGKSNINLLRENQP